MDDLAQKFEALASNIGLLDRQAGDLPPSRARFATSTVSTGLGIIDVASLAAITGPAECVKMTSTLIRTGGDFGEPLVASLRPAIFDRDGATIDPAEFAQPLH